MLPRMLLCSMEQKSFPSARAMQRGGSRKLPNVGIFVGVMCWGVPSEEGHGRAAKGWRRRLTSEVIWIETSSDLTSRATLEYTLHHRVVPILRQVKWTFVPCVNVLLITGCCGRGGAGGQLLQRDSCHSGKGQSWRRRQLWLEANICQGFCPSAWNRIWSVYYWHQTESLSCAIRSSSFSY